MGIRLKIAFIFLALLSCKRSSNFYNQNNAVDPISEQEKKSGTTLREPQYQDKRDISKNDLDDINAGDGLTVGNGQNDSEEIEAEKNPIEILGSFLASCRRLQSKIVCKIPDDSENAVQIIKNLVFVDSSGLLIPSSELKIKLVNDGDASEVHIEVASNREIAQIAEENTIDIKDQISNFISQWVAAADYIENKQEPNILYARAPAPPALILLKCSEHCPGINLLEQDKVKLGQLCELLTSADTIEGMTFDEYFSSLINSCNLTSRANEQAENAPTFLLHEGEIVEVGKRLVNGSWSMLFEQDSIKIESDQNKHSLSIGNYQKIELISEEREELDKDKTVFALVAHTGNGRIDLLAHRPGKPVNPDSGMMPQSFRDLHILLDETGRVFLNYKMTLLDNTVVDRKILIHSEENPWQIPKAKLDLNESLEVGQKLVNGTWSMVLENDSIKITSGQKEHVLNIGNLQKIEFIMDRERIKNKRLFILIAHTDNGMVDLFVHHPALGTYWENIHFLLDETGQIFLNYKTILLHQSELTDRSFLIHSEENPWQLP